MFAKIKNKITKWWQNQIKVLPTEPTALDDDSIANKYSGLMLVLPRQCYFETYKTYPLSIGRDIQKVAQIDGRQISPYGSTTWIGSHVIKDAEKYVVYYFVALPKYQKLIEQSMPVFIFPETAHKLSVLTKAKSGSLSESDRKGYYQDQNSVWLSDIVALSNNHETPAFGLEQMSASTVQAFFNPNVVKAITTKFNRWQQVKWLSITAVCVSIYLLIAQLYLSGMDWYLADKNAKARPIISELFKAKDSLDLLQRQQQEFAIVYGGALELSEALMLIDKHAKEFELEVKSIEFQNEKVSLQATANNANGLLEKLLASDKVTEAEFKSDIKRVGRGQSREQFEIEFSWQKKLYNMGAKEGNS